MQWPLPSCSHGAALRALTTTSPTTISASIFAKAVLSPKRLGPETRFAPVALEARGGNEAQARAEPVDVPKKVAAERVRVSEPKVAHVKPAQPRGAARTKLAHRHGNPLDAQAMDTRIQTWPCRSGGICNWKH
ncbi:hypothetical protein ACVWXL_001385 [Bradyrhizobium sp. GM22.5]